MKKYPLLHIITKILPLALLTSCGGTKKIKDMNFEEAALAKENYAKTGSPELQITSLERMLAVSPDHATSESLLLELGKLYIQQEHFEKAQELYKLYGQLYPGSEYLPGARFNEIRSHFALLQSAENDQTETRTCISLITRFISEFPHETEYIDKLIPLLKTCYYLLVESELVFARLHVRRFERDGYAPALNASKKRLRYIEEKIIPDLTRIDNQAEYMRAFISEGAKEQAESHDIHFAITGIEIILGKHATAHPRDSF